jgi:hypothetical protein
MDPTRAPGSGTTAGRLRRPTLLRGHRAPRSAGLEDLDAVGRIVSGLAYGVGHDEGGDVYFAMPHFDKYPAILVRLDRVAMPELEELLIEAWLICARKRLVTEYLDAPLRRATMPRPALSTATAACQSPCRSGWGAGCLVAST